MDCRGIVAEVALVVVLSGSIGAEANADEARDLTGRRELTAEESDGILKVLRERTEKVQSGRFLWDEDETIFPGTILAPRRPGERSRSKLPKELVRTHDLPHTFQFAGSRMFYRYFPPDVRDTGKVKNPTVEAFDGETLASLHPPGELFDHGHGIIYRDARFQEFTNLNLLPFFFMYRPLETDGLGLDPAALTAYVLPDGDNLLEFRTPRELNRFFVDPAPQFRLRRYEGRFSPAKEKNPDEFWLTGVVVVDSYRTDPQSAVDVPEHWTIRHFTHEGSPQSETIGTLTGAWINVESELESFSLVPFPEGTRVQNGKDGTTGWQRAGGKVEVTERQAEPNPAARSVPAAPTESTPEPAERGDRKWVLIAVNTVFVLAMLGAWRIARRRAKKK